MQHEFNPKDGTDLHFGEENIKNCISHKSIKKWVYIRHDKDPYTEEDKDHLYGHKIGDLKNAHWHIVLQCDTAIEIETIAKWLGVPMQQIEIPKGHGKFLDSVQYITHEDAKQQKLGKHLYGDDEMTANFDWRGELTRREENKLKYGNSGDLSPRDQMRYDVLYNGMTLRECKSMDRLTYMNDCQTLEKLRHRYLTEVAQMPTFRINFYIDGDGGVGKNTAAKLLAKVLFPDIESPYFEVGRKGVEFQHYDGEKVVIWNDKRASGFISDFGREGTFDLLDMHPSDSVQNVKYGSTRLINEFNIINGVDSYTDFLDGLAGEYTDKEGKFHEAEDKSQSYRRFPIIVCIRERDFDCLLNKGVMENTREYQEYIEYKEIVGSFARVAQRLEGAAQLVVARDMLDVAVDGVEKIKRNEQEKISDPSSLPEEFKEYGIMLPFR